MTKSSSSDQTVSGTLFLALGDQLDHDSPILSKIDADNDAVWMAEAAGETMADKFPVHQVRLAFSLSAMRHYRDHLRDSGLTVHYHELTTDGRRDRGRELGEILAADLKRLKPARVAVVEPGDHRLAEQIEECAAGADLGLDILTDTHFLLESDEFAKWASGRKEFLLETINRFLPKRTGILMEEDNQPEGGQWNFDKDNRESFGRKGPDKPPSPPSASRDRVTRDVIALVGKRFGDHPGDAASLSVPVDRRGARKWLNDFVRHRLPGFGRWQDAMWSGEAFLHHSRLSAMMNAKLLHPQEVIDAALEQYREGDIPLNSVEGFVRQILGWREFVRGIYRQFMPDYENYNHLEADRDLPSFFWDGDTEMACVRDAMTSVLEHGYAHHIQRLMVLGLFSLLYGSDPLQFHRWHMAMYVDASDWVSMPNTIGMSQYGDGGIVGTKPYCASGAYIRKMGNYCGNCRYDPAKSTGPDACPFTVLYWNFLDRHEDRFKGNRRLNFQVRNLQRKSKEQRQTLRREADRLIGELES